MASNNSKTVILDQPSHWEPWLFVVKTIADGGDTWRYMNPDLPSEPAVPIRPIMPTPTDINPAKTTLLELDLAEKESFKIMLSMYKEELVIAKQVLNNIQAVQTHIVATVSIKKTLPTSMVRPLFTRCLSLSKND